MVAYALLISITISLSIFVYGWLKFYVAETDIGECSDDVNVVIQDYICEPGYGTPGTLNLTLKNKGLFNVDGFIVRVHNREGAEFGFYTLDEFGEAIGPGDESNKFYDLSDSVYSDFDLVDSLTLIEVQPFLTEDGGEVMCKSVVTQKVECPNV
ncbi:MAG: hypothetical protein ABIF88_01505 [archaeon]